MPLPVFIVAPALLGAPRGVDRRQGPQSLLIPMLAIVTVLAGLGGAFRVRARARSNG